MNLSSNLGCMSEVVGCNHMITTILTDIPRQKKRGCKLRKAAWMKSWCAQWASMGFDEGEDVTHLSNWHPTSLVWGETKCAHLDLVHRAILVVCIHYSFLTKSSECSNCCYSVTSWPPSSDYMLLSVGAIHVSDRVKRWIGEVGGFKYRWPCTWQLPWQAVSSCLQC